MGKTKDLVRSIKLSRSKCLVVTCIPCNTPFPERDSPNGCANCGMMEWLPIYETEEECNEAFKKEYPEQFDINGKHIGYE